MQPGVSFFVSSDPYHIPSETNDHLLADTSNTNLAPFSTQSYISSGFLIKMLRVVLIYLLASYFFPYINLPTI